MRYTRFLLIALFLMAGIIAPMRAQAQVQAQNENAQLEIFTKELPVFDLMPQEKFAAQGMLFEKTPLNDESLAYSLILPKEWVEGNSFGYSLSSHVFVEIGRYTGPVKFNKERSHLVVNVLELDHITSAKEWFTTNVWKNGYSVQGTKEHNPNLIEALHVELVEGESFAVRSLTMINGARLIQVAYYLPLSSWDEEKVQQNQVINSFRLLNPVISPKQKTTRYDFLDVMSFSYPSVLDFSEDEGRSLDFMSLNLVDYDAYIAADGKRIVNGHIRIMGYSDHVVDSLAQEMSDHIESLVSRGFVIQHNYETKEHLLFPKEFTETRVEVYDVLDGEYPNRKTELWVVGMASADYYFVLSLVTPARESQFEFWTRNTEALKAIISSFEMHTSSE